MGEVEKNEAWTIESLQKLVQYGGGTSWLAVGMSVGLTCNQAVMGRHLGALQAGKYGRAGLPKIVRELDGC